MAAYEANRSGKSEKKRAEDNNTQNLRNAAEVAIASGEPHAAAIGTGVKMADKLTGGKSTELLSKAATKAIKQAPGGKNLQKGLNELNESGTGDKIGKAAGMMGGDPTGGANPSTPGSGSTPTSGASSPSKPNFGIGDNAEGLDGAEELEEKSPSSSIMSGISGGKKSSAAGTSMNLFGTGSIKPKIAIGLIGAGAGLFFLLFIVVLIAQIFSPFASMFGAGDETGIDTGGIGGSVARSESEQQFYDNLAAVQKQYNEESDQKITILVINSTFTILQINNPSFTYQDMTKSEMEKIANMMVDAKAELDEAGEGSSTEKIESKTKEKLAAYFKEKIPGKSDKAYQKMANEVYQLIDNYNSLITYGKKEYTTTYGTCEGTGYWWPIGSAITTTENGKVFAKGDPETLTITATFAGNDSVHQGSHGALDISGEGKINQINVIAALDGTVIYPTSDARIDYPDTGYYGNPDGGGFGNYVVIEHADGNYTYYAHMAANSITVRTGDTVRQGQVIGKVGHSGSSTGPHLHFEVRAGSNSSSSKVDPLDYVDTENPRSGCSEFSLLTTSLTKQEFVSKMTSYCTSSGNSSFCTNFSTYAETVYDVSVSSGVNPELVVVTAGTESGWKKCGSLYNFWGIGISNGKGCSAGPQLTSLEAGIKEYASVIADYQPTGSKAQMITNRYNEREAAGCSAEGHGLPGTLAGMQSVYSWLGTYRYNPGNSGLGGCYYLNIIYGDGYCSKVPSGDTVPTTVCEQNDYTAWQLKGKREMRKTIFGL